MEPASGGDASERDGIKPKGRNEALRRERLFYSLECFRLAQRAAVANQSSLHVFPDQKELFPRDGMQLMRSSGPGPQSHIAVLY